MISELYNTTYEILRNDTILATYCTTKFCNTAWIAIGYDESKSLTKEYDPLIQILKIQSVENEQSNKYDTFNLDVGVTIRRDETISEPNITDPEKKIVYEGVLIVESFRAEVEQALIRGQKKYRGTVKAAGDTINDSTFPIYKSISKLIIKTIKNMR